jgi:hypothetical protein
MQTFLPHPNFGVSARVLDYRRLGKQRLKATQILSALEHGSGWTSHPAVLMWAGYEAALRQYRNAMIREWVARGFRNTMGITRSGGQVRLPPWLGDHAFHASHRSALLRKDPEFYGKYGWTDPPDLPYVWPVRRVA